MHFPKPFQKQQIHHMLLAEKSYLLLITLSISALQSLNQEIKEKMEKSLI